VRSLRHVLERTRKIFILVVHAAIVDMAKAATTLGAFLPRAEPQVLAQGSSFHFQGTFRMGEKRETQDSVCDPYPKVWDMENLYLGGNGIIPTATACNPTLTSVALALRACENIASDWKKS
jgi:pyranose oxidase